MGGAGATCAAVTIGAVQLLAAGMILLFGGVGVGLALAKWKRHFVLAAIALTLIGLAAAILTPRGHIIQCRIAEWLRSEDAHPLELVGAWVGWDTKAPPLYCRLELGEDGTGRCAMWYREETAAAWRVTRWYVSHDRIELDLTSGERQERMRGDVYRNALSLLYFGNDGAGGVTKNWLGPLLLVPEAMDKKARQAAGTALR